MNLKDMVDYAHRAFGGSDPQDTPRPRFFRLSELEDDRPVCGSSEEEPSVVPLGSEVLVVEESCRKEPTERFHKPRPGLEIGQ